MASLYNKAIMKEKYLSLGLVLVVTAVMGALPFIYNNFMLTTPDMGGLACGSQHLAETGQFSDGQTANLGYNFTVCWTKDLYPALQWIHAGLLMVLPVSAWQLVQITTVLGVMACGVFMWFIVYSLTRSPLYAGIAGIFTAATPALLRAAMLTPQNVHGYALILLIVCLLCWLITKEYNKWWLTLLLVPLLFLGMVHQLSFGIIGLVLVGWILGFYLQSWIWRFGFAAVALVAVLGNEFFTVLPFTVQSAWALLQHNFGGYDKPLWDHPSIWGYLVTALAAVGWALYRELPRSLLSLFTLLVIVPVILGHLSVFGIILLPDRFITYAWLGLVPLACFGLIAIQQRFAMPHVTMSRVVLGCFFGLLLAAQVTHGVVFVKDDVNGWSKRFKPSEDFITAMTWLNDYDEVNGIVLGIMAVTNREITFSPTWYDGPVISYPWYNLNHRNLKKFQANSALYKSVFENESDPEYQRVLALYTIITKPNQEQVPQYIQQYNVRYYIIPIDSQAYDILAEKKSIPYQQIYSNELYVIYELQ